MRATLLCLAALASQAILAAQTPDPETLTVAVSQTPKYLPPDEVYLSISVYTPADTSLDEVLAILADARVTAADLTYASSSGFDASDTLWSFTIYRPIEKMTETLTALLKISAAYAGVARFDLGVSPQPGAPQECPYPSLVSHARKVAQTVAEAAGVRVGPGLAVSDSLPSSYTLGSVTMASEMSFESDRLDADPGGRLSVLGGSGLYCGITVQFKLLH